MGRPETVLVLTELFDPTADMVIEKLNEREVPVFRCDMADFPHDLALEAELAGGRWRGTLRTALRSVALEDIGAVWYRRPSRFHFAGLGGAARRFAAAQARAGLGGVLAALPCRWVNHPHAVGAAEYKAAQLPAAARSGLRVAPTLVTSVPEAQRRFAARSAAGVVYKPLAAGDAVGGGSGEPAEDVRYVYTRRVPEEEWAHPEIAVTAHLFQDWLPKDHEVRLVAVDGELFPAAIHAGSERGRIDWRTDYASHRYRRTEVPADVERGVLELMRHFGLTFAALDFVVRDGEWTFLEINPNGQWAWLEAELDLPISGALAHCLAGGSEVAR